MSLKAILEKLEGIDEKEAQHYVEKDGKFYLQVEKAGGLALENVDGLKSTVEKLRTEEKTLQQALKTVKDELNKLQESYKDINPEVARSALSKIDEIKNWDGETKVKEAVAVTEQRMEAKVKELAKQHKEKMEALEADLVDSQNQLQEAIVNTKIVESVHQEGGNVNLLMPHVRNQVQMTKDSNGVWRAEIINKEGNPRIGDSEGNPMTITQLVQEMKTQETFAAAFPGANSTGTGKTGSNEGDSKGRQTKAKVVAASDRREVSKNLEDIATGKVEVDMTR